MAVGLALHLEPVEDRLLVRVGPYLEPADRAGDRAALLHPAGDGERPVEAVPVHVRVVADERGVRPVGVKGRFEPGRQFGRVRAGELDVPLQAVQQGRAAQVGRADVGRVVAAAAAEHPRLGVQASRLGLVVDLDLGPEVADQAVQGGAVGRAHVRRREDPQRHTPLVTGQQLVLEYAQAVPLDERAQQVNSVGRGQLRAQLGTELGVGGGVGQQRRAGQGNGRTGTKQGPDAGLLLPRHGHQLLGARLDNVTVEAGEQGVDQGYPLSRRQRRKGLGDAAADVVPEGRGLLALGDVLGDGAQVRQPGEQVLGEQALVDAGRQRLIPHGRQLVTALVRTGREWRDSGAVASHKSPQRLTRLRVR